MIDKFLNIIRIQISLSIQNYAYNIDWKLNSTLSILFQWAKFNLSIPFAIMMAFHCIQKLFTTKGWLCWLEFWLVPSSFNAIRIIDYAIYIFWAQKLELKLEQLRLKTLSLSRASRNQDLIPRIIWRNTLMKQKIQSSRKDSFRWGNSFYLTNKSTNIL